MLADRAEPPEEGASSPCGGRPSAKKKMAKKTDSRYFDLPGRAERRSVLGGSGGRWEDEAGGIGGFAAFSGT